MSTMTLRAVANSRSSVLTAYSRTKLVVPTLVAQSDLPLGVVAYQRVSRHRATRRNGDAKGALPCADSSQLLLGPKHHRCVDVTGRIRREEHEGTGQVSRATSDACCRSNSSGPLLRKTSRLRSFHAKAGNSLACGYCSNDQSRSPAKNPARKVRSVLQKVGASG